MHQSWAAQSELPKISPCAVTPRSSALRSAPRSRGLRRSICSHGHARAVAAHRVARRALGRLARTAEQLVGAATHLRQRPGLVEAAALVLEGLEDAHEVGVDGARLRVKPRRRVAGEGERRPRAPTRPPPLAAPRPCAGGGAPPTTAHRRLVHQKREQHRVRADGGRKVEARRRRAAAAHVRPREAEQRVEPHGDLLRRPAADLNVVPRRVGVGGAQAQQPLLPARRRPPLDDVAHAVRLSGDAEMLADPRRVACQPGADGRVDEKRDLRRAQLRRQPRQHPHEVRLRDPHRRRADDDVEGPAAPLAAGGGRARRAAREHGGRFSARASDVNAVHGRGILPQDLDRVNRLLLAEMEGEPVDGGRRPLTGPVRREVAVDRVRRQVDAARRARRGTNRCQRAVLAVAHPDFGDAHACCLCGLREPEPQRRRDRLRRQLNPLQPRLAAA